MERKHKNLLIAGLIAIVLVMSVGYAAFATTLNINGTASIDSTWDVHFDPAYATGGAQASNAINVQAGKLADGNTGTAIAADATHQTITYPGAYNNLKAELVANLRQPGDTVTFTLKPTNYGTISAKPGTPTITLAGGTQESTYVYTKGHIKFTVTPATQTLATQNASDTMTVVAEFMDTVAAHCGDGTAKTEAQCTGAGEEWIPGTTSILTQTEEAVLTVDLTYTQAS